MAGAGRDADAQPVGDAERIRAAVLACPDVAGLCAGAFGEIVSSLPGRSVPGLRIDAERVEVHVVAHYGPALRDLAAGVARAVDPLLAGRVLRVAVDDILLPGETLDTETADTRPSE